jgi:uncharacterized phosphosugar-binding protein
MDTYIERYFAFAADRLRQVADESGASIYRAAEAVARAIEHDKDFLLFGSGHSALIAREAAWRAGGLAPAMVLEDIAEGDGERLEGLAALILGRYELRPGSVLVVISNSGINAVPIEIAMAGKERGLTVIALTSLAHSQAVSSRHSSGKKLYELADIVIDSHTVPGDAALELPGSQLKSGATSTVIGAAIIEAIVVQAAALLAERGIVPPVLVSSNLPEGDAHNRALAARYRPRLIRYQISALSAPDRQEPKT